MPSSVVTTGPFSITTPESSSVAFGTTLIDLTPTGLGVPADGTVVLKTDVQTWGPVEVNLLTSAVRIIRWRPGFAGTAKRVSVVLSGATVATGAATVAVGIAGTPCTLSAPISFAIGQAAGAAQDVSVDSGGAWTADQTIDITPAGTNSAATFGGVVVEYERA